MSYTAEPCPVTHEICAAGAWVKQSHAILKENPHTKNVTLRKMETFLIGMADFQAQVLISATYLGKKKQ